MDQKRQVILIECKHPQSIAWVVVDNVAESKEELFQIVGHFVLDALEKFQEQIDTTGLQPELLIKPVVIAQTKLDSWDVKALLADPRTTRT